MTVSSGPFTLWEVSCNECSLDRQVPTEEEGLGHGPVALHSPIDEEAVGHIPDDASIDTTLTVNKPRRKRTADCCVCCGLKYASSLVPFK